MATMRLSKRLNPWHKVLPIWLTIAILTTGTLVGLSLIVWIGLITHDRSTYEAIGTITISPVNNPTKYYTLRVGSLDEAAKKDGLTDTISVGNSADHWYSISNHKDYTIMSATWPNGQRLKLSSYVVDPVSHEVYLDGSCTIPSKNVREKCLGDDGKLYYVGIETVGPNIIDQLNAPLAQ